VWERLLPKVRTTLSDLALHGYRQAPLVQQGLISVTLAVRNAICDDSNAAWQYLTVGARAANEAAQISCSPLLAAERRNDRSYKFLQAGLGRAIGYLTLSAQSCAAYLTAPHPAKLERAVLRLEDSAMVIAGIMLVN